MGNHSLRGKFLHPQEVSADGPVTPNYIPGLYPYKFLYVWLDLTLPNGERSRGLGWFYGLPNPLLPFIWFRVAVPRSHPELTVEEFEWPS